MTAKIANLDLLIAKFKQTNFDIGIVGTSGGWKDKAKQHLTAYTMAAQIMTLGVPDDRRIGEIQVWLDTQYREIEALDTKQAGWKSTAIILLSARLKTFAEFHARLWRAALRLFNGGADAGFIATFARSIDVELTKAWNEGARSIGVEPDEMTDRDIKSLALR